MARWSDSTQVREGLIVIGYDDTSKRYSFRDTNSGRTFEGLPGDATGHSIEAYSPPVHRPLFENSIPPPRTNTPTPVPSSFHDILPPNLITTPPSAKSRTPGSSPRSRFIRAVRRATMPKMRGVVDDLAKRRKNSTYEQLPIDKASEASKTSTNSIRRRP